MPVPAAFTCQLWDIVDDSGSTASAAWGTAARATQFTIPRQFAMSLHGVPWFCRGMEWSHPVVSWDAQSVICMDMEWAGAANATGCTASSRIAEIRLAISLRNGGLFARMNAT